MSAIIQVWSAPSCQAGAVCFGPLSPWVSAAGSEAADTAPSFRVTVPRGVADAASLAEGRCLRVISQSRGEQWWFVSSVADSSGDAAVVTATAGPLRQLLTVRGLVRSAATSTFTTGKQTATTLLNSYVLTNLAEDGLAWLSLGTIEPTDAIELGTLTNTTRAGVLDAIESATGYTARLRGLYSAGVLTGFALDIVSDIAAGLEVLPMPAVQTIQRTRDALRAATVAVPFDTSGNPMERPVWRISAITGTAPAWVELRDPNSGNPWPIRENGQTVGLYLEQRNGTQTIIADSRAVDSAVQVASVGTLAVNDLITIVKDTAGTNNTEVLSPSGVASSRGRLLGTVSTKVTDARRNYVGNGIFSSWTSDTAPDGYTIAGGTVARYPRNTTAGVADMTLQTDGVTAPADTFINVRGGVAGQRLYFLEYFTVNASIGYRINANTVTFDGTGRATIPLVGTVGATWADGSSVQVFLATTTNAGPQRPVSLPSEAGGDVCRLLSQNTTVESAGSLVRVPSGTVAVNAAAGISIRSSNVAGSLSAAYWPQLLIRNTGASTTLATAASPTAVIASTAHYVLSATANLSTNTTISARIQAGVNNITGNAFLQWQGVRWLSLWVGSGAAMGLQDGSGTNTMWHRAQDVLASNSQGTRYTLKGIDLQRLVQENGVPSLNQQMRLRDDLLGVDATVRIVKLDYDFAATEALNLELGAVTPRLTGVTVSL